MMIKECWKPGRIKYSNINKTALPTLSQNYWSPLTGLVNKPAPDSEPPDIEVWDNTKTIRWLLPQRTRAERRRRTCFKDSKTRVEKINQVMDAPTAVFDSGATSNCGRHEDPFVPTSRRSTKVFHLSTGHTTAASVQAKLHHLVREPARTVCWKSSKLPLIRARWL